MNNTDFPSHKIILIEGDSVLNQFTSDLLTQLSIYCVRSNNSFQLPWATKFNFGMKFPKDSTSDEVGFFDFNTERQLFAARYRYGEKQIIVVRSQTLFEKDAFNQGNVTIIVSGHFTFDRKFTSYNKSGWSIWTPNSDRGPLAVVKLSKKRTPTQENSESENFKALKDAVSISTSAEFAQLQTDRYEHFLQSSMRVTRSASTAFVQPTILQVDIATGPTPVVLTYPDDMDLDLKTPIEADHTTASSGYNTESAIRRSSQMTMAATTSTDHSSPQGEQLPRRQSLRLQYLQSKHFWV